VTNSYPCKHGTWPHNVNANKMQNLFLISNSSTRILIFNSYSQFPFLFLPFHILEQFFSEKLTFIFYSNSSSFDYLFLINQSTFLLLSTYSLFFTTEFLFCIHFIYSSVSYSATIWAIDEDALCEFPLCGTHTQWEIGNLVDETSKSPVYTFFCTHSDTT